MANLSLIKLKIQLLVKVLMHMKDYFIWVLILLLVQLRFKLINTFLFEFPNNNLQNLKGFTQTTLLVETELIKINIQRKPYDFRWRHGAVVDH